MVKVLKFFKGKKGDFISRYDDGRIKADMVRDVPKDFAFVVVDVEVESIKALLGEVAKEFDSFYIKTENGKIIEAYGMHGIIPHDDKPVYKIL